MCQWARNKINRKSTMKKNDKKYHKSYCYKSIKKSLKSKWPIDKDWFPSYQLDDANLIFLKKDKIANNHINNRKYRKTKKSEKDIHSILKR